MAKPCKIPPDREDFQGMKTSPCQATVCVCVVWGRSHWESWSREAVRFEGAPCSGVPRALERLGGGVLSAKLTAP